MQQPTAKQKVIAKQIALLVKDQDKLQIEVFATREGTHVSFAYGDVSMVFDQDGNEVKSD